MLYKRKEFERERQWPQVGGDNDTSFYLHTEAGIVATTLK